MDDEQMATNWLALLEEMQVNGNNGKSNLYAWWVEEQQIIEQSISELEFVLKEIKERRQ